MDETDEGYHFVGDRNAWRAVLADEPRPFTKAILYHDDPNAIAPLTAALDKYCIFELAPSVMYGGELRNVEVNRMGVHKGRGLEWLAHHLGCTLANVIAIGDSENDLTMLQMAGLGVAMAKQRAVHPRSSGRYHRQQYGKRCRTGDLPTYSGGMNDEKVVAIGELLIDFVPQQRGCALDEVVQFERVAGGAPANVATAVARLGGRAQMISQVERTHSVRTFSKRCTQTA